MVKTLIAAILSLLASVSAVLADAGIAAMHMQNAQLVGKARFTFLAWTVYDAELYAPFGKWRADEPYALTLHYRRAFTGKAIAQRSIDEIRKQGFSDEAVLANWQRRMERIMPDVTDKSSITGVRDAHGNAVFYLDGREIGVIADRAFARHFFDIWLGKETSEPAFRRKLIGAS